MTIQGSYVDNDTEEKDRASLNVTLSLALVTRQTPNKLFVANYSGVIGSKTFVTGQFSQKDFGFRGAGGTSTALVDSPFRARGVAPGTTSGQHYHAPFFSALDPEDRDNTQFAGSAAYFLTTKSTGTHNLKAGVEHFTSSRVGGNSQSATNYVFQSDFLITGGVPSLDAQGRIIPLYVPGVSRVQNWLPTLGASMDITTLSFYLQDHWQASDHFSFDLGVRFEKADSEATGDIVGADTHSIVPRLGMTYDPKGDGRTTLQATYAHYSGKYSDIQYARNTAVGSPSLDIYQYTGPAGQGFDFSPGMDLANYPTIVSGQLPDGEYFPRGRPGVANHEGVHAVCRAAVLEGLRPRDVNVAKRLELHRGFHRRSDGVGKDSGHLQRRQLRHVRSGRVPQQQRCRAAISGTAVRRPLRSDAQPVSQRPLHGAAPEQRQLRGRSRQPAGQPVGLRRLSGDPHGTELSRRPAQMTSRGARFEYGPSTTRPSGTQAR